MKLAHARPLANSARFLLLIQQVMMYNKQPVFAMLRLIRWRLRRPSDTAPPRAGETVRHPSDRPVPLGGSLTRLASPARSATLALALVAALGATTQASAAVLVSNLEENTEGTLDVLTTSRAQGFRTGAASGGYTLTSIEIDYSGDSSIVQDITVHEASPTGTLVATLIKPAKIVAGVNTYTAPEGISLKKETTYYVVLATAFSSNSYLITDSANEFFGPGWSIEDRYKYLIGIAGFYQTSADNAIKIRVNGTVTNTAPTVANEIPDQTATAETLFSYTVSSSAFSDADSGDTLTYMATKGDDSALPSWLIFTPGSRAFSGTPQSTDTGTVAVKVTANDGNGGSVSDTFDIVVSAAPNTVPTARDGTVTTPEDEDYIFTAANFNYMDADSDTLANVKIVTLATPGVLKLDTTPVTSNQEITKADIDDKKLKFSPVANAHGNSYATFTFKVNDGTDDSAPPNTMTIDVTPVNDPPTGLPEITGAAQVGQMLTASVSNIMDVDGLNDVSYRYEWTRFYSTNSITTFDRPHPTYTIVDADKNKKIRVEVFFTDDDGNNEALTSAATAVVAAADTAAPTVTITDVPTTANAAFTATFTFSETVTGFMLADITASGAAASRFSAVSGTTYTALITPSATNYSVSVAASVAQDAAGNDNAVSATASGTYDTAAPTVTITGVPDTANAAFTATFTFSETVTGFELADITVSGAAASDFATVSSGTTYTALITPSATNYSVSVAEGVAQDASSNGNTASSASGTYDTAAPMVTITDVPTTANAAFTATFTFSETVTGFTLADITASGAAASSFSADSGTTYTALITPSADYSVSVAASVAQDAAGNDNAVSATASGTYDADAPTVTITDVPTTANAAFTATFTFSETVTGFELADITVSGAAASDFATVSSGTTYTALITPSATNYSVSVAEGVAQDASSNGNTASSASGTYDAAAPTVTITGVPDTANAAFTATFTFSETVTGFELADITVSGAAASDFATVSSGTTYTALITPSATNYSVSVAEGVAQDASSNGNTASSASGTYDADAPTVTITGVPDTANAAFTATFTFSETVTGFELADITVSGAAASDFATVSSGTTYTALITPSATNYSVSVAEGVAQDASSNGNTASSASGTYDAAAPTVTITGVPDTANAAFTATFTFSETVTGFELADITVSGAAASDFATVSSGTTYTALITPSATNYSVSVAEGVAQDASSRQHGLKRKRNLRRGRANGHHHRRAGHGQRRLHRHLHLQRNGDRLRVG